LASLVQTVARDHCKDSLITLTNLDDVVVLLLHSCYTDTWQPAISNLASEQWVRSFTEKR